MSEIMDKLKDKLFSLGSTFYTLWKWFIKHAEGLAVLAAFIACLISYLSLSNQRQSNDELLRVTRAALALQEDDSKKQGELSAAVLNLTRSANELQLSEFRLRNRPILSIPLLPMVVDSEASGGGIEKSYPLKLVFNIKNASDIPATHVAIASEILINGISAGLGKLHSFPTLTKGEVLPYSVSVPLITKDKVVRIKLLIWYEGIPGGAPAWFESYLELFWSPEFSRIDEHFSFHKAHWSAQKPNKSNAILYALDEIKK